MNKTMCPGQDTRYWRPGDIFNVTCASCGNEVEFFRDDVKRRCSRCDTVVQNPRLSTGCARWCGHAKECLGYDPAEISFEDRTDDRSLAEIIIALMQMEFGSGSAVLAEPLRALERAAEHLKSGSANPRVVIPAVLLLMADRDNPGCAQTNDSPAHPFNKNLPKTEKILRAAGIENNAAEDIRAIIRAYHSGELMDTQEYRIVAQSHAAS
jgi:hypothetical protein